MGNFPDLNNNKNSNKHERIQQHFCVVMFNGSVSYCDDCFPGLRGEPVLINGALWNQMQVFTRTRHADQCLSS